MTRGYACTNGDDLDEEIYLALLSIDDETDLTKQVRTENRLKTPELIRICKFHELPIQVFDPRGIPVVNTLVGLWKPAASSKPNFPSG